MIRYCARLGSCFRRSTDCGLRTFPAPWQAEPSATFLHSLLRPHPRFRQKANRTRGKREMRGQVLGVDRTSGEGQISGEDGHRYTFRPGDWSDEKGPVVGARIDFTTEGTRALRIFRLPDADQPVASRRQPAASDRNRVVAALLAFFLGIFGIHRFYLGQNGSGLLMLIVSATVVGLIVTGIWAFIDTIRYLVMSDAEFDQRYARL